MTLFKKMILVLFTLVLLTLAFLNAYFFFNTQKKETNAQSSLTTETFQTDGSDKKTSDTKPPREKTLPNISDKQSATFNKSLTADLKSYLEKKGHFSSVYYVDMSSKKEYSYDGDSLKLAASCSKLPWIIKMATLVDQKKLDPGKKLTYTANYFRPGSGEMQHQPFGTSYTLYEVLHELTDESDNIAFAMIYDQVAHTFPDPSFMSEIAPPPHQAMDRISSKQLAFYLKYIVDHLEEPAMAHLFKKLTTTNSDDESGTNLAITDGRKVANKVGWMPFALSDNDVAYIYGNDTPYIVSIMTEGYTPEVSRLVIQDLTAIVDKHHAKLYKKATL